MKKIIDLLKNTLEEGFEACGYDRKYGMVSISNRPDLCQYQCNGAMAGAKAYKKAPAAIAAEVVDKLKTDSESAKLFDKLEVVMPGFINMNISDAFVAEYLNGMKDDEFLGVDKAKDPITLIVDYGGPNVAKPLHVGHLRSAVIGESIKRIARYMGHNVIGDVHLGDWGLQMGLIITELHERKPDLPYFDESFTGEYPSEAPFTISELEEIYPTASGKSKEDEDYKNAALAATYDLQHGRAGYRALWKHIIDVSVSDLKKNYANLNVDFDLWKGESDADKYIADMVQRLKDEGFAYISEGALVVDVAQEDDKKEIPPCMILKSDGAALYETTDLATLVEREKLYKPDEILYVVDKRQGLHFEKVFRCAKKTGIVREETALNFLGFGTMNGKDGKPFKTREGGVMRLERLIAEISDAVYEKMTDRDMPEEECRRIAKMVGLAALKYGDLSNQASKDYVFDLDRFASFEGNTGPYIQYTIVRIKSILHKNAENAAVSEGKIITAAGESERDLSLMLSRFNEILEGVYIEKAPHKLCQYMFELANAFNRFYHDNRIISEEDEARKASWLSLIGLVADVLSLCLSLLGIDIPERM